jgi:hypothetical protein
MAMQRIDWNSVLAQLVERASTDEDFRARCLRAPEATLQSLVDQPLPEGMRVRMIDGRGADMTVILPPAAAVPGELTENDLESVSGGTVCIASCGVSCVATCLCMGVPTLTGI